MTQAGRDFRSSALVSALPKGASCPRQLRQSSPPLLGGSSERPRRQLGQDVGACDVCAGRADGEQKELWSPPS